LILLKESIGTLSAFLAVENEIQALDELAHSSRRLEGTPMLSHTIKNRETHDAIERYVMAAIVDAREVYTEPKWLTWADHWINGRDRSFASARSAHRMARQACDRESVALAAEATDSPESMDSEFSLLETGAEMAAWAAGLALVTAPVAPDLTAGIRRIEFALRKRFAAARDAEGARSTRPLLAGRAVALARRAASMVMPSEVPQTVRLSSR